MHLALARCAIRSWRPDDAERLAAIANDRSIWIMVRDRFPHPYARADADAHIARVTAERPQWSFAITEADVPVGGILLIPGDDTSRVTAEVGYWLGAGARGRGIGTEALRGLVAWTWAHTGFTLLRAVVFTDNPASGRILEKAGFARVHTARRAALKDGVLRDEWLYECVRPDDAPWPGDPAVVHAR